MFKRIERRPMAWPCQLTIGSSLAIRIVGYKAVSSWEEASAHYLVVFSVSEYYTRQN